MKSKLETIYEELLEPTVTLRPIIELDAQGHDVLHSPVSKETATKLGTSYLMRFFQLIECMVQVKPNTQRVASPNQESNGFLLTLMDIYARRYKVSLESTLDVPLAALIVAFNANAFDTTTDIAPYTSLASDAKLTKIKNSKLN